MMYTMIATVDIISAVGFAYQMIFMWQLDTTTTAYDTASKWNFVVFYALTTLPYRASVFYNVVLAVCRTIKIVSPFYFIKKKVVLVACLVYPSIWTVITGFEVNYFIRECEYLEYNITHGINPQTPGDGGFCLLRFTSGHLLAVSIALPCLIVYLTCIIQVISLNRTHVAGPNENQRAVTVTILMLSVLFVVCNLFHMIFMTLWKINELAAIFSLLNAAFNPVILICRSSKLRKEVARLSSRRRNTAPSTLPRNIRSPGTARARDRTTTL